MDIVHDPIEDDPLFRDVVKAAEREAEEELVNVPKKRGFCHRLWSVQKRILREKYGVAWKSPAELNGIFFD